MGEGAGCRMCAPKVRRAFHAPILWLEKHLRKTPTDVLSSVLLSLNCFRLHESIHSIEWYISCI